jgi:glutamate racemase
VTHSPQRAGFLDSGLGGLTVLSALRANLPHCDVVYFADTAHAPYGDKPLADVARLGYAASECLLRQEPSLIVVASGTTCAAFEAHGWPHAPVPLLGIVRPGAAAAVAATRNKRIGVVATQATIDSGIFERALRRLSPEVRVHAVAAPALVPLVESGDWDSARAQAAVQAACASLSEAGCDTVVLGCTHFPHLQRWFRAALPEGTAIVDPGAACASKAAIMLTSMRPAHGRLDLQISGAVESFCRHAAMLCSAPQSSAVHVEFDVLARPSGIA